MVGVGSAAAAAPSTAATEDSQEVAPQACAAAEPSHVARPSLAQEEAEEASAGAGGSDAPAPAAAAEPEAEAEGEGQSESGVSLP